MLPDNVYLVNSDGITSNGDGGYSYVVWFSYGITLRALIWTSIYVTCIQMVELLSIIMMECVLPTVKFALRAVIIMVFLTVLNRTMCEITVARIIIIVVQKVIDPMSITIPTAGFNFLYTD